MKHFETRDDALAYVMPEFLATLRDDLERMEGSEQEHYTDADRDEMRNRLSDLEAIESDVMLAPLVHDLSNLSRAMKFAIKRESTAPGTAQAKLRRDLAETPIPDEHQNGYSPTGIMFDRIMGIGIDEMPPEVDLVALVLDTLVFRLGSTNRADAWRRIGVNPNRGRDLLARNHNAFDWPLWFTLREAAFSQ